MASVAWRPDDAFRLDGVRVLVVDDAPDVRAVVAEILTQGGAKVTAAGSAEEALTALQRDRPDVLLSDLGMPEKDGYWLIGQVRALPPGCGGVTPAGALTGFRGPEHRENVLRAGFQLHVEKPFGLDELIEAVAILARENRPDARCPFQAQPDRETSPTRCVTTGQLSQSLDGSSDRMSVFIVEDSGLMVDRLVSMLADGDRHIDVIGQADNAPQAIDDIQRLRPHAVVLDMRLSRGNGIDVLEAINQGGHRPVVVMLTNCPEPQYRRRCFAAGVDYFFDKSTEFDQAVEVLRDLTRAREGH
jgi:CheY-like chemotaxis protein